MNRPAWLRRGLPGGGRGGGWSLSSIVGVIALVVLALAVVAVLLGYGDGSDGGGDRGDGDRAGGAAATGPASRTPSPSASPSRGTGAPVPIGSGAVEGTVRNLRRVDAYAEPRIGADKAMSLTGGARVIATCHRPGPATYYGGRRSEVWVHVVADNRVGFVPAVYLDTGGDVTRQVVACS